ncbi:MAG: hypothetical protein H0U07_14310 [Actinobacteria bacterium]|nr:hypothetical protein [Actinomycetota bacterium]
MRTRIVATVSLIAAALLGTAAPALAGAPNYTCRFGTLRIVADIHRDVGLLQEKPGTPLRTLGLPSYGSGGSGFTAVRGRERFTVRLLAAGDGKILQGARSELVRDTPARRYVQRGVCTAITGNHQAGRVTNVDAAVRTAPRPNAPPVTDASALPFVWSSPDAKLPPAGWVAVRLWRADGHHTDGFLPEGNVRFIS